MLLVTPRKKTCSNALTRGRVEPASYPRTMVRDDKTMMFKHGKQDDSQFEETEKNTVQIQTQIIISRSLKGRGHGTGDKVIK